MFIKNNKYKDIIIVAVIIISFSLIGIKLLEHIGIVTGILDKVLSLSMSFIYGIVIAYVLNPIVKLFQNKVKLSRGISIVLTYTIFIVIIGLLAIFGIPSLIKSIKDIITDIPGYIDSFQQYLNSFLENEQITTMLNNTSILAGIESYISKVGTIAVNILEGSFVKVFSLSSQIIKFILGLLVSIYVLIDKDRLIKDGKAIIYLIFKEKNSNKIIEFGRIYHQMIGTYIGIKAIDSTIIGSIAFILLTVVKSEYALLLAIIVGITNMIPYFGPFIGEIIGFFINVFISPTKGIIVFIALFSLQMFDGWYLDPKLIGKKVGVRPFWIIYAVVIGGGFFGPVGMLLASPTAATIKVYYSRLLDKHKLLISKIQ